MKILCVVSFLMMLSGVIYSQDFDDIAPGFSKNKQRNVIKEKMASLLKLASLENDCPVSEFAYEVIDEFKRFYTSKTKELPQKILLTGCGKRYLYVNESINGNYYLWGDAQWTLESVKD